MKRRTISSLAATLALIAGIASAAAAEFPTTPIRRCAADAVLGPGALVRGGSFVVSGSAGPLRVIDVRPSFSSRFFGFRCAR